MQTHRDVVGGQAQLGRDLADGIAPTPENIANGRYPFVKTLGFVWREDTLLVSARAFVKFVQSEDGAGLLKVHGYLPVR